MTDQELFAAYHTAIKAYPERALVIEWLLTEWEAYATPKFGTVQDRTEYQEWMRNDAWSAEGDWRRQVLQYADRCELFFAHGNPASCDNDGDQTLMLKGKQAAMKMATTLIDGLATMILIFGNPPAPGQTSGDIKEWKAGGEGTPAERSGDDG